MTIDPAQSTTPFASTADVGYFGDKEDEVLFSMHTIFSIDIIIPMDANQHLFQVNLTLTNDNNLRVFTNHIRQKSYPEDKGWNRLGLLLLKVGASATAQQVHEVLLKQTTDMGKKSTILHQLEWTKSNQGQYDEAITFYEKALEIQNQSLPSNHSDLAYPYKNMREETFPPKHPSFTYPYKNIGNVYNKMGEYSKAGSFYQRAIEIGEHSLPTNHPELQKLKTNLDDVKKKL